MEVIVRSFVNLCGECKANWFWWIICGIEIWLKKTPERRYLYTGVLAEEVERTETACRRDVVFAMWLAIVWCCSPSVSVWSAVLVTRRAVHTLGLCTVECWTDVLADWLTNWASVVLAQLSTLSNGPTCSGVASVHPAPQSGPYCTPQATPAVVTVWDPRSVAAFHWARDLVFTRSWSRVLHFTVNTNTHII